MRELKLKYNYKLRNMLNIAIRGKERKFFRKVTGFGYILERIDFQTRENLSLAPGEMDISKSS